MYELLHRGCGVLCFRFQYPAISNRNELIDEDFVAILSIVLFCLPCAMNQVNSHLILRNKQFRVERHPCDIAHWMGCLEGKHLIEAVSVAEKGPA